MAKQRHQLRILLLQIRDDAHTCQEELDEFVRYSHLEPDQFTVLNTFATPEFEPDCIDAFDALFVGGSSDASVTKPEAYPFVPDTRRLVTYCVKESIPVFASCFGFQAAVEALGGHIIVDRPNMEMGTFPMQLTAAAQTDLLFHDVPDGFWAVVGHQERAALMPTEATVLAYTERCPYHAFRIEGKPFYGFQFHPEVNPADLIARLTRYEQRYFADDADGLSTALRDLQDTPIANSLIHKFVDRILLAAG